MARSPVTRAQVDAYRFGLRRMDAALVRRDPVPLHEDIRGQRRTVAAGLVLAILGLAVAAVYGLVVPSPDWHQQTIVVGRQSGALYVVANRKQLVPVANLAAARLVLAAISPDRTESGRVSPTVVEDSTLTDAPRTAAAAVPGAAAALPGAGAGLGAQWAVCDEISTESGRAVALSGTTVVAGVAPQGRPMDGDRALLVRGTAGSVYLVHHGKRQRVELSDRRVAAAFDLSGRAPRPAADPLLDAIPEAAPLRMPDVGGLGDAAPGGVPGKVGDVVRSAPPGAAARLYVLLADGVQEVSAPVAALLQSANPDASGGEPPVVRWDQLTTLPNRAVLDVADYPAGPLRLLDAAEAPTVCLSFAAADGKQAPELLVGPGPPSPGDRAPTRLAQADGPGPRLDAVYLQAGQGAAVRAVALGHPADTGPLWLISDTGVAYGVPDPESAAALGISGATAAPEVLLRLLPTGEPLSLAAARRTVDVLAPGPG
jgi:type VII secretion protein EccB